jgi:hypothetical protein
MKADLHLTNKEIEEISNKVVDKLDTSIIKAATKKLINSTIELQNNLLRRWDEKMINIDFQINSAVQNKLNDIKKDIQLLVKEELKCQKKNKR